MAGSSSSKGGASSKVKNRAQEPGRLKKKYQDNTVDKEKPSMNISLTSLAEGVITEIPCNNNALKADVEDFVWRKVCFRCQDLLKEDKAGHMFDCHRVKYSCPRCFEPFKKVNDVGKLHKLEISGDLSKKIGEYLIDLEEEGSDDIGSKE